MKLYKNLNVDHIFQDPFMTFHWILSLGWLVGWLIQLHLFLSINQMLCTSTSSFVSPVCTPPDSHGPVLSSPTASPALTFLHWSMQEGLLLNQWDRPPYTLKVIAAPCHETCFSRGAQTAQHRLGEFPSVILDFVCEEESSKTGRGGRTRDRRE